MLDLHRGGALLGDGLALAPGDRFLDQGSAPSRHGTSGVERVGFLDVDDEELDVLTVLLVEFGQPTG
jgi:hypothetical protein